MERIRTQSLLLALVATATLGATGAPCALAASDPAAPSGADGFAESRFGAPPARPESARHSSRFAAKVGALDEEEIPAHASEYGRLNAEGAGSRRPAGLEFAGSPVQAAPPPRSSALTRVRDADETPRRSGLPAPGVREPSILEAPNARGSDSALSRIPGIKRGVQEISLIAGDLGYFPRTVFVTRDIPVRLFVTGASKSTLCIMMDSFQVKKQVRAQKIEEITFTPATPGAYRFYCPIGNLEGTLVVREFGGADEGSERDEASRAPASDSAPSSASAPLNAPAPD